MILAILAVLPAIALGWAIVRLLLGAVGWLFEVSLGVGVGLGVTSLSYFLLSLAGLNARAAVMVVDLLLLAAAAVLLVKFRRPAPADEANQRFAWIWILRGALTLSLVFFALDVNQSIAINPYGDFDAITTWNRKARFIVAGSPTWRDMDAKFGAAHPGYPLLLPASVARLWSITGDSSGDAPAVLSVLFTIAAVGVLFGAIKLLGGETLGLLAALVLLGTEGFVSQAGAQYADIPLALSMLSTLALLMYASVQDWPPRVLMLAGLCAGFAAWTKTEGLLFLILTVAVATWRGRIRSLGWMTAAAMPPVLVLIIFELLSGRETDSTLPRTIHEIFARLADPARWTQIAASFARSVWQLGSAGWAHPILVIAILAFAAGLLTRREALGRAWLFALPIGMLIFYFGLFLVTPVDLGWYLGTSNIRLVAQVWPMLIFAAFLMMRSPAAQAPRPKDEPRARKPKTLRSRAV